jgi:predicted nucleic acid-binding protein
VTLVDTNVLLDIATNDPVWADWSIEQLDIASGRGPVLINVVIYSEFSVGYARIEDVDRVLADTEIRMSDLPREALFLAGKVFQDYRRRGGARTGVLPDFFIGAHAAVADMPLITRDPRRYRAYFPTATLLIPEGPKPPPAP